MTQARIGHLTRDELEEAHRLFGVENSDQIEAMVVRFGRVMSIVEEWSRAEKGGEATSRDEEVAYTQ